MKKQSLILAVILVLGSVLSSCGSETTSQTGTTTAADGATATEETDLRFVADELPDLDFGGKTMNVVVGDYFGAYWTTSTPRRRPEAGSATPYIICASPSNTG